MLDFALMIGGVALWCAIGNEGRLGVIMVTAMLVLSLWASGTL